MLIINIIDITDIDMNIIDIDIDIVDNNKYY